MSSKKGKFTAKAHSVLGVNKPSDMRDFLSDDAGPSNERAEQPTENVTFSDQSNEVTMEALLVRNAGNTETRKTGARSLVGPSEDPSLRGKTEREEFRFTPELAERLRRFCYEQRAKKTKVVTLALEAFLEREGY